MNNSIIDQVFQAHFAPVGAGVKPEQRKVIESILAGYNTLCLMPTGAGKSLCYWVAGKALGGVTLVVFPLTALMDEQAEKLTRLGMQVVTLHSGVDANKQVRDLIAFYRGQKPDFIFLSPERIGTDGFLEFILHARRNDIKLVVIDEIHCVSQWGVDFRPFYKEIPPFLQTVFRDADHPPTLLGLTATLNQKDTEQSCQDFSIAPNHVLKSQFLLRFAIELNVIKVDDEKGKDNLFWAKLGQHQHEKVLVYVENRNSGERSTEGMCEKAQATGFAAAFFHGSMKMEAKKAVIQRFKAGEIRTVFATSAFGMGIDIPDIRGVIHYRPPESVEQYYQQIGRVGRDGKPSWALLYYSDKNIAFRRAQFIDKSFPDAEEIRNAFQKMTEGAGTIKTFNYFQEEDAQSAYHYLLRSDTVDVVCKGVSSLDVYAKRGTIVLPEFDRYLAASPAKLLVRAAARSNTPIPQLIQAIYRWQAEGKIEAIRSPAKCLVLEQKVTELPDPLMEQILTDVAEKKQYRHSQLDELIDLLNSFTNSINLHQAIGRYLGIDEFQLGRVHETTAHIWVRSKSEVIIANLLTAHGVNFTYEEALTAGGKCFSPDFTIRQHDKIYYWEHLGMLDREDYRLNWTIKKAWYDAYFPGQLITTEESSTLSPAVERTIRHYFI